MEYMLKMQTWDTLGKDIGGVLAPIINKFLKCNNKLKTIRMRGIFILNGDGGDLPGSQMNSLVPL